MRKIRFTLLCCFALAAFAAASFAQSASDTPSYIRRAPVNANSQSGQVVITSDTVLDAVTGGIVGNSANSGNNSNGSQGGAHTSVSPAASVDNLDTVPTFDGAFFAGAGPDINGGKLFRYSMIGGDPLAGKTTNIPAKIAEVSLVLLNANGSVNQVVPFDPFESLMLQSPNFSTANYRSGSQIQYDDAIMRAQFYNRMDQNWHTVLQPQVVDRVSIAVPPTVRVRFPDGTIHTVPAYVTSKAADGNTAVRMLDLLFENVFFPNVVINEIELGNFTTDAIDMTWFPNTYLYSVNLNNPSVPGGCCVLGFHTYFFDPPSVPQSRWITLYASWISPGLFKGGFQDVTALSHELAESFADPFVDNATPNWQFPGVPATSKMCQNNLEEGDPIEVLPTATVPISVKDRGSVFTYHPQIIPLLQWFEMGASSNAIDGAFSFPDETTLTHSALPCPQ